MDLKVKFYCKDGGNMKDKIKRYYFDYNIYEKLSKEDIKMDSGFLKNNNIFLSVVHIEEYYKAYKNDVQNLNKDSLEKLKNIMIEISKKRIILNPVKNSRIHAKNETFDECYDIIQKYDTRDIIENDGKIINKHEKCAVKNLREEDNMAKFNSTLDAKEIWKRPEVLNGILEFSEFYKDYNLIGFERLSHVYGINGARKGISDLPKDFKLCKDCFKNNIPNFHLLECVIEYLHKVLSRCGFHRDKEVRKTISGIHDVSHSIYATYCNYFVTLDENFRKRVEAVYYYLGLETDVISFDELIKKDCISKQ